MRWTAAAVTGLLLAGEVFGAAHAAVVRHAVCADHGETVHAAERPGDGAPAPSAGGEGDGWTSAAPAPAGSADEHEHCKLAATRTRLDPPALHGITAASTVAAVLPDTDDPVPPAEARFRLAPKSSPPHAG